MDLCCRAASCDLAGTWCPLCANDHAHPPGPCGVTQSLVCGISTALGRLWHCWSLVLKGEGSLCRRTWPRQSERGSFSGARPEIEFYQSDFQDTWDPNVCRHNLAFLTCFPDSGVDVPAWEAKSPVYSVLFPRPLPAVPSQGWPQCSWNVSLGWLMHSNSQELQRFAGLIFWCVSELQGTQQQPLWQHHFLFFPNWEVLSESLFSFGG